MPDTPLSTAYPDLTTIAGLTEANDDLLQRKAGAWTNRTLAQVKADLALNSVDNTADTAKPVSTAQQTALNLKANLAGPTFSGTVGGITKAMVGLGSADNTADTAKPVSTAQQTALDLKANLASPTFTGTVNLPATTATATDLTAVPPATGGWKEYFVTGSNATTTGQALVDITGLVTDALSNSTKYEIEVVLDILQSADVNGCKFGIHVAGTGTAGTCIVAGVGTSTTSNAAASYSLAAVDTATNGTFVSFSAGTGSFIMKGWVTTTSTGTTTISIQHLKVTSGTSSIKPGSILRIRKAHT